MSIIAIGRLNVMKNVKLVPSDIDPGLVPATLANDPYYFLNDESVKREQAVKQEILELQKDVVPWHAALAQRYAKGESIVSLAKSMRRAQREISVALQLLTVQRLIHHWQHLEVLRDGPNELLRKQMLWRIAVDNERADPKEATKALAELNKMTQKSKGGAQTFQIVINNQVLSKGPLDE